MNKPEALGQTFFDKAVARFARRYNLSERELDVFVNLVKGATSSESISERLGVSRNTVRNHFQNIFYKSRTNSKTELLANFISDVFGEDLVEGMDPLSKDIHILYVEDDDSFAKLVQRALKRANAGGKISIAENADRAIALLNHGDGSQDWKVPDVILLDLMLPDRDGVELLSEIRKITGCGMLPVIAFTGSEDPKLAEQVYKIGGNSLIQKPMGFRALVELMRNISVYWVDTVSLPEPV